MKFLRVKTFKAYSTLSFSALFLFFLAAPTEASDFLKAISAAFPIASPVTLLIVGVFILLGLTFIVGWEIYRSTRHKQDKLDLSWQHYSERSKRLNLTPEEDELFRAIISAGEETEAAIHFDSANLYEKSLNAFLISQEKNKGSTQIPWVLLHGLRKKLGFHQLPMETKITSTRQLSGGIKPFIAPKGSDLRVPVKIVEVSEENWTVQCSDESPAWLNQANELRLCFVRASDAEYELTAKIVSYHTGIIILQHTLQLTRKQLRNWVRVDVNLPCKVQVEKLPQPLPEGAPLKGSTQSGKITDISGGGVCLRCPEPLPQGTLVLLNFDLPSTPIRQIKAEILFQGVYENAGKQHYIHRTKFFNLDTNLQERIVRFIFEKNRNENQLR